MQTKTKSGIVILYISEYNYVKFVANGSILTILSLKLVIISNISRMYIFWYTDIFSVRKTVK
jgi:hypothetical protein